jgi:hypothetical protein
MVCPKERLANILPRPNWSRPLLPRPLVILDDGKEFLRLSTLADVLGSRARLRGRIDQ